MQLPFRPLWRAANRARLRKDSPSRNLAQRWERSASPLRAETLRRRHRFARPVPYLRLTGAPGGNHRVPSRNPARGLCVGRRRVRFQECRGHAPGDFGTTHPHDRVAGRTRAGRSPSDRDPWGTLRAGAGVRDSACPWRRTTRRPPRPFQSSGGPAVRSEGLACGRGGKPSIDSPT
jgi:hypothetical protein